MVVGVNMRSALAASAIAAAAANKRGKKRRRRRTLLTPCSVRSGVDAAAVGGTSAERSCCCDGFEGGGGGGGTRDWSGLPEPAVLLILVALLPSSFKDAFSMGSVCRAWRSVFAACKREIFLALPPLLVDRGSSPGTIGGFYGLRERRFHRRKPHDSGDFWPWRYRRGRPFWPTMDVIGTSHGYWVVRPTSRFWNGPSAIFLVDPLSPEIRIPLPPTPHHVDYAVMAAPPTSPDCVVVLMDSERILYCRPGDTQWTSQSFVEEEEGGDDHRAAPRIPLTILDPARVAIAGGKFYALHKNGKVIIAELMFPRPTVTFLETNPLWSCYSRPRGTISFLMESNGEILHVAYINERKLQPPGPPCPLEHRFVVRRLDVAAQEWVTLSTLGDRCLFLKWVGACVASVSPAKWGGEGDCIYVSCHHMICSLLVFHMKDGRAEHHRMPIEYLDYDWLFPSFCY